jgi:F-type H+-transporting ATPase subunit a
VEITPDQIVFWQLGALTVNATLVWTWVVMAALVAGSWMLTRGIRPDGEPARGQRVLQAMVSLITNQIRDVSGQDPRPFLPFIGTLFLFILASNLVSIVPGSHPPTGSLSTTAALAVSVFVAVPVLGIRRQGLRAYLRYYAQPSVLMLPLNLIGEVSRTVALALRLFGNMMSGAVMVAMAVSLAPLLFPVLLQVFGLVIGTIQAYIFSVLATVYIAAATSTSNDRPAAPATEKEVP